VLVAPTHTEVSPLIGGIDALMVIVCDAVAVPQPFVTE
jgi:hypothetical protein